MGRTKTTGGNVYICDWTRMTILAILEFLTCSPREIQLSLMRDEDLNSAFSARNGTRAAPPPPPANPICFSTEILIALVLSGKYIFGYIFWGWKVVCRALRTRQGYTHLLLHRMRILFSSITLQTVILSARGGFFDWNFPLTPARQINYLPLYTVSKAHHPRFPIVLSNF